MHEKRATLLAGLAALCLAVAGFIAGPPLLDAMREAVFDRYQRIDPPHIDPRTPLAIIDIDEESLAQVGQWPWPRDTLAILIDTLDRSGAAAIALDILLAEPDRLDPEAIARRFGLERALLAGDSTDATLAETLSRTQTALGFVLSRDVSEPPPARASVAVIGPPVEEALLSAPGAVRPLSLLEQAAPGLGAISISPAEGDAIVRRVPLLMSVGGSVRPGLALEALRLAAGERTLLVRTASQGARRVTESLNIAGLDVPLGPDGSVRPRFGRLDPAMTISAGTVLAAAEDGARAALLREALDGRIVFIGSSAAGLFDLRATPLGAIVPGVEVHVQALAGMLNGALLTRPDYAPGAEFLALLLSSLGALGLVLALRPGLAALAVCLLLAGLFAASMTLFLRTGLLIDALVPASATLTTFALASLARLATTDKRQRFIRKAFAQYLSGPVLARLESNPDSLSLGGEERIVTVMFADLVGFTRRAEQESPQQAVSLINRIMTPLADCVLAREGTIDKFMGDAMMAFWNAPLDQADHALRAVETALAMQEAIAPILAEIGGLGLSIGLHTGPAFVGNMGSRDRFAYTVVGDSVNLAARLETMTRDLGHPVLISAATRADIAQGRFVFKSLGAHEVKGRAEPVEVFGVWRA